MIYMCNACKAEAHPGECVTAPTDLLNVFLADSRKAIADLDDALGRFKATLN
jgi:hypothetical protein